MDGIGPSWVARWDGGLDGNECAAEERAKLWDGCWQLLVASQLWSGTAARGTEYVWSELLGVIVLARADWVGGGEWPS